VELLSSLNLLHVLCGYLMLALRTATALFTRSLS
jgi:hypothetical protein